MAPLLQGFLSGPILDLQRSAAGDERLILPRLRQRSQMNLHCIQAYDVSFRGTRLISLYYKIFNLDTRQYYFAIARDGWFCMISNEVKNDKGNLQVSTSCVPFKGGTVHARQSQIFLAAKAKSGKGIRRPMLLLDKVLFMQQRRSAIANGVREYDSWYTALTGV